MNLIAMILCILLIMSCGESIISSHKDAWNNANDPSQMKWPLDIGKMYQTAFNELPLFGSLEVTPWSGNYWPTYMGGISHRWNSSHPKSIQSYSYDISPDQEDMSILSPAEKYDLYLGFYSMPLTRFERKRTQIMKTIDTSDAYDPQFKIPRWEGLCHDRREGAGGLLLAAADGAPDEAPIRADPHRLRRAANCRRHPYIPCRQSH